MKIEKKQKTGGRQAGTPNKVTTELRVRIADLIDVHFDALIEDIAQLEPKERIDAMIKLFEYSLPKLQRVQVDANNGGAPIIWNETKIYDSRPKTLDDWYNVNRSNEVESKESE